jgi:hypothetical protein
LAPSIGNEAGMKIVDKMRQNAEVNAAKRGISRKSIVPGRVTLPVF